MEDWHWRSLADSGTVHPVEWPQHGWPVGTEWMTVYAQKPGVPVDSHLRPWMPHSGRPCSTARYARSQWTDGYCRPEPPVYLAQSIYLLHPHHHLGPLSVHHTYLQDAVHKNRDWIYIITDQTLNSNTVSSMHVWSVQVCLTACERTLTLWIDQSQRTQSKEAEEVDGNRAPRYLHCTAWPVSSPLLLRPEAADYTVLLCFSWRALSIKWNEKDLSIVYRRSRILSNEWRIIALGSPEKGSSTNSMMASVTKHCPLT